MLTSSTTMSLNIILHMLILFTFLSILFFSFISKIEEGIFKSSIENLLGSAINNAVQNNKADLVPIIEEIKPVLQYVEVQYASPERATLKQNIMIKFLAAFTVLLLLCLFITIVLTSTIECGHSVPLGSLILENVVIFLFVGLFEYIFFVNIAMKYIPAPPSLLMKTVIESINKRLQ